MRPVTKEQWQDAVDTAELLARITTAKVLLFIEMGRLFELMTKTGKLIFKPVMRSLKKPTVKA